MKMILKDCDIPVVDYVWFTDKQWYREKDELVKKVEERIGYPVIVKPANLGSSVGRDALVGSLHAFRALCSSFILVVVAQKRAGFDRLFKNRRLAVVAVAEH